jgi:hypothetical protein
VTPGLLIRPPAHRAHQPGIIQAGIPLPGPGRGGEQAGEAGPGRCVLQGGGAGVAAPVPVSAAAGVWCCQPRSPPFEDPDRSAS